MPDITTQAALETIGGKGGGQACFQQHFSHVTRCDISALALALPNTFHFFRCFNIYLNTQCLLKLRAFAQGAARGVKEEALETAAGAAKKF